MSVEAISVDGDEIATIPSVDTQDYEPPTLT